jgi:uncharacterized membrane protein
MKKTPQDAILEAAKEGGRVVLFAAITALIGYLGHLLTGLDPNSLYYIAGTTLLKLVDKYVHENEDISAKGIAPF